MRIGILAYDNCFGTEVFAFSDILRIANQVAGENGSTGTELFRTSVVAAQDGPVAAAGGFTIGAQRWHHRFDQLVVPGFDASPAEDLDARLDGRGREIDFLRAAGRRRTRIASVCVGAFLLGEAGLLDERRSTTSWLFASQLARRYPRSTVCAESMVVGDGHVTTTAAFSASLDLAIAIVRDHLGAGVARATARITLVAENRTSQAPSPLPAFWGQLGADRSRGRRLRCVEAVFDDAAQIQAAREAAFPSVRLFAEMLCRIWVQKATKKLDGAGFCCGRNQLSMS